LLIEDDTFRSETILDYRGMITTDFYESNEKEDIGIRRTRRRANNIKIIQSLRIQETAASKSIEKNEKEIEHLRHRLNIVEACLAAQLDLVTARHDVIFEFEQQIYNEDNHVDESEQDKAKESLYGKVRNFNHLHMSEHMQQQGLRNNTLRFHRR
jgi:hypothetical protein